MSKITTTRALRQALAEEMKRDRDVILMGEDIGCYGGAFGVTRGLLDEFGKTRVLNTPISEQGFVGAAVGAALVGSRPVVEMMFMDFITLAVDQLVNQAAKLRYVFGPQFSCPLVVRAVGGGGRSYGPTHSQSLASWFVHAPGIKVVAPSTPADARGLLKTAIRDNNPVVFIEHKMLYPQRGEVPSRGGNPVPLGKARVIRTGEDLTIVAWSWMAAQCEQTLEDLAAQGLGAELIDLRTLSPMDTESVVSSVQRTGRLLIVEEACRTGGVGAEVAARVFERVYDYLEAPVKRLASADVPVPASPVLEQAMIPDRQRILDAAVNLATQA
jgi:pyruvate/2-oxoglutarate/acetoin dehydrogenase E1 component